MEEEDDGLLSIEVDADEYAETAAGDTPSVSRTYQSEANFQVVRASYAAKIDNGNTYRDLVAAVPVLETGKGKQTNGTTSMNGGAAKVKLGKKNVQLLRYAVGELYYDKDYAKLVDLCERVRALCEIDEKTAESMDRWVRRCRERMS